LATVIIITWLAVGRYEWQPPPVISNRIKEFVQLQPTNCGEENDSVSVILKSGSWECIWPDLEKDIFFWQQNKNNMEKNVISFYIRSTDEIGEKEKEKAKLKLEHRFKGLTVHFCRAGEEDAVLYPKG